MKTPVVAPKKRSIPLSVFIISILLIATVGFIAGNRSHEIKAAIGPLVGINAYGGSLDFTSLQSLYRELKANYDGELDDEELLDGAKRGMAAATGDQYTAYMGREQAEEFMDSLSGSIGGGIGAEIGMRNERTTIVRILEGNPAGRAGMRAGDAIMAVNGESTDGLLPEDAARKIRGEPGTTVQIDVMRGEEPREFTVRREVVNNPSVSSRIEDNVGIMTLYRFDEETATLARKAAEEFRRENVDGVVLDVRNNGGGYLRSSVDVAGIWLSGKTVVTERAHGEVTNTLQTNRRAILEDVPTIVLINGHSASASEIVAGALKDHRAASLLGETTFGKGTVQKIIRLSNGSLLRVTNARWFTPNGRQIDTEGIAPDVEVEVSLEDLDAGRDPQLERAKRELTQ